MPSTVIYHPELSKSCCSAWLCWQAVVVLDLRAIRGAGPSESYFKKTTICVIERQARY